MDRMTLERWQNRHKVHVWQLEAVTRATLENLDKDLAQGYNVVSQVMDDSKIGTPISGDEIARWKNKNGATQ